MTTTQHPHADRLAAIAQHLNRTDEATAPNQTVGGPYTSKEGDYIRVVFHSNNGGGVNFRYAVNAYMHPTDIYVQVHRSGIDVSIMVPGDTPADVVARAAMSALRTANNAINAAQQGAAV